MTLVLAEWTSLVSWLRDIIVKSDGNRVLETLGKLRKEWRRGDRDSKYDSSGWNQVRQLEPCLSLPECHTRWTTFSDSV